MLENTPDHLKIRFYNNTEFAANVKVFIESGEDMDKILGEHPLKNCINLELPPGSEKVLIV